MNTTTLRGIFPEPKPVYKRNYIKENVRHIKQMQGVLQNSSLFESKPARSKMPKLSQNRPVNRPSSETRSLPISKVSKGGGRRRLTESVDEQLKPAVTPIEDAVEKHFDQAVQTENSDSITKLYEKGVIKYPSPAVTKMLNLKQNPLARRRERNARQNISPNRDRGDIGSNDDGGVVITNPHNDINDGMQALDLNEKHDFIKENIMALKNKAPKSDINNKSSLENYQKGVLPKYLRERKEEQKKEFDNDAECPEGHVLLPEEERRETLRVLRQSYADRIQELNSMPVRNDTLRMRKRKMAIEEELKKIDEGIKVFQRPKVFVKINA